jgi:hypothetical protein
MEAGKKCHPAMPRLVAAYLDNHRPNDWPTARR